MILEVGKRLAKTGEIPKTGDIFYLTVNEVLDLSQYKLDSTKAKLIVSENRRYFESFQNFDNPED